MLTQNIRGAVCAAALLISAPSFAAPNEVVMKDFDFSPMTITVKAGTAVTWKNLDGEPHTIVSIDGAFRSAALDQGDSYSFTFAKPGTYRYVCSIHPKMRATVIVQ